MAGIDIKPRGRVRLLATTTSGLLYHHWRIDPMQPRSRLTLIFATLLGLLLAKPALAYIGPGAGITMLGALWAVVVAILLALGAVVFWPIRMLLRRWRKPATQGPANLDPTKPGVASASSAVAKDSKV